MTRLCFVDTETTSLRHDRRAWEIAVIVREPWTVKHPGGPDTIDDHDTEHTWFIDTDFLDLGNADPASLRIGRFYDRHPQARVARFGEKYGDEAVHATHDEIDALWQVEALTRGAHIVGAVPSFDAEVLSARMRDNGICPSWHYHLIDVEPLAAGWLHRHAATLENRVATFGEATAVRDIARPPWKSDDLSAALGVTVSEEDRHTALGDARWARDLYDKVVAS